MAIIYSYPIAQPSLSDLVLGTHVDPDRLYDGNPTKSFYVSELVNLVATKTVSNATATPLNSAALNVLYPTAMIGFRVQCTNSSVLKIYEKTNTTAWVSYTIAVV